ncbi:isochorismate synthase [Siminovitchia sp. 179-K 8D1 HS]|uniref:isochorismate synthase n=1 Tax=Siminovitchia sp. 179-K 8D1 HS TaxID=3142385 RepID=UPI0039A39010
MINLTFRDKQLLKQEEDKSNKVLFSITRKIKNMDPIFFYKSNRPDYKGESFFWKSPDDGMVLVGLGITRSFVNNSAEERFGQLEKEWMKQLGSAIIDNPFESPGTGPLLFGGFSFDPYSMKEELWQPFGDALFYLPEFMLTRLNGDCFMTVNLLDDKENKDGALLYAERGIDELVNQPFSEKQTLSTLMYKEENSVAEWLTSVGDVVNLIKETTVKKVVLSRKMRLVFSNPPASGDVLTRLNMQQPNSFIFSIESGDCCFVGASPERLVKKSGEVIFSTSLAGSIGRNKDPEEDRKLGQTLMNDEKNLHEHALVVEMIKKALEPHCENMDVPKEPVLLKTPYIQHLYTPVRGKAKTSTSIFQLVEKLHPTPALGGVPTSKALEIIREKEMMDRGFYAAPIGWTDFRGNGEFIVAIRSGLMKQDEVFLYAGCGLVADSEPEDELKETGIKFQPMLQAMEGTDA